MSHVSRRELLKAGGITAAAGSVVPSLVCATGSAPRAVRDLVAVHVGHRAVHTEQDLEVLAARVDVLRNDVHAGIEQLRHGAPLLGE